MRILIRIRLVLVSLILVSCRQALPGPAPSVTPVITPAETSMPPVPTPTLTHTPKPTPTSTLTPLPTATPTPLVLVEPGTPIPQSLEPISYDNAPFVSGLAQFKENNITDLEWSPDGATLAIASYAGIAIYDAYTRSQHNELETSSGVISIDFNPQGSLLAVGHRFGSDEVGYAGNVDIWRVSTWQRLGPILGGNQAVSEVVFSPSGNTLASAFTTTLNDTDRIVFWDAVRWEISRTLQMGVVQRIAFSPDGKLLAASPDRYAVQIYRLLDNNILQRLRTSFTGAVNVLAFSPDGSTLATGHYDGEIRLWNALTGEQRLVMKTDGVVESLAFNRDGTILASGQGGDNKSVRLWDVDLAQPIRTLDAHTYPVISLEFSPDGRMLASGSYDGTVWLWGVRP